MNRVLNYIFVFGLVAVMAACAHEAETEKEPNAHLKNDTYEVSAQGGDEMLLRSTAANEVQTTLSGVLKVRGVKQKFVGPLDVHLVDRDGTIYARTKSNKDGSFSLRGALAPGKYKIKVIAKKYKGELVVAIGQSEIKDLVVPVEAVIR
ncbi:MAG: carboxypeptidase-like regulatory domain-containing protein [Bdellovibrio sp.]